MYYVRMAAGVAMCAVGGWQLVVALDDGPGGGDADGSSAYSYQWTANCDRVARRAFGSAPYSTTDIDRGMLSLRERGCDPAAAPTGVIPMVSDDAAGSGSGNSASDDWASESEDWQLRGDGWGD